MWSFVVQVIFLAWAHLSFRHICLFSSIPHYIGTRSIPVRHRVRECVYRFRLWFLTLSSLFPYDSQRLWPFESKKACRIETCQGWCHSEDTLNSSSATIMVYCRSQCVKDWFLPQVSRNTVIIARLLTGPYFACRWSTRAIISFGGWRWACTWCKDWT